jgi:hypothetical protein
LNIIPPRPPGYRRTPELFLRYTGATFDPLAAAETAANLTIGLVLQPERAARLVDYHSRDKKYPGLSGVLDKLVLSTWKSAKKASFKAEIQRVVNNVLLYNLMRLSADEQAPTQVRAIASLKLEELRRWLDKQMESLKDEDQKAHYYYACSQIKLFQENPEKVKLALPLRPPAGAPIGMRD